MLKPQHIYKEVLRVNVVRPINPEINYIAVLRGSETFKLRDILESFLLREGYKLLSRGGGFVYKEVYSLNSLNGPKVTLAIHNFHLFNINIKYQDPRDIESFINYVEGFFKRVNQSYEIY